MVSGGLYLFTIMETVNVELNINLLEAIGKGTSFLSTTFPKSIELHKKDIIDLEGFDAFFEPGEIDRSEGHYAQWSEIEEHSFSIEIIRIIHRMVKGKYWKIIVANAL